MDSAELAFSLTIDRTPDGLLQLGPFVDRVTAALRLGSRAEYALRICLEEAVANLVMHGRKAQGDAPDIVALQISADAHRLSTNIEDHCIPFDPRDVPVPARPAGLAEVTIGGLGIHLMRQYATAIDYQRFGDTNRLTLTTDRG